MFLIKNSIFSSAAAFQNKTMCRNIKSNTSDLYLHVRIVEMCLFDFLFCFLSMPLCKVVSIQNKTESHITGLAFPGSETSFFVHPAAALANPAALCGFQAGIRYPGNGNRNVVSTPVGGHACAVHSTQLSHQFSLEVLVGHGLHPIIDANRM